MRLNRGTLILILVSVGVIIAALLLNNSQVTAPQVEPTPSSETVAGPLFPDLDAGTLTTFEVHDNRAFMHTQLGRDSEGGQSGEAGQILANWTITDTSAAMDYETDAIKAQTAITTFAGLQSVNSFPLDGELSSFSLDNPNYTLTATDSGGKTYSLKLGTTNAANRTYALVNDDAQTIYLLRQTDVQPLLDLVIMPPYVATSTPTITPTSTPNPYSEVEQTQTATIEQVTQTAIAATLAAEFEATMTALAVTPEVTGEVVEPTDEPTEETTPES